MKNIINKIRCALCTHFLLCPMCKYFNLEDSDADIDKIISTMSPDELKALVEANKEEQS